jgi:uncharacterized repeat protein (TIGR02543 family)
MPSEPGRSGYTFDGWYTGQNGGGTQFTDATMVTANITVYAKWTAAIPTTSLQAALTWLDSNAVEGGVYTITLNTNETIAPNILSYSDKNVSVTIKGDGTERTVTLSATGSLFTVESGVTLTLDSNVTLLGRNSNTAPLVRVNSGGTLIMNTGTKITGNTISGSGGGVYISDGAFTMNDGTISGNTVSGSGGGVYISDGTFTMNDGTISGNTASASAYGSGGSGGGVYISDGTFIMNDGTISGNTASIPGYASYSGSGGGVYVWDGIFTMNDGTISDNTASYGGGGVCVFGGAFTMSGGTISGNTASGYGGGVYIVSSGTFIKQLGSVIYGSNAASNFKNTAVSGDSYGHAVYVFSGSKKRNSTAGTGVVLDTTLGSSAGGWE